MESIIIQFPFPSLHKGPYSAALNFIMIVSAMCLMYTPAFAQIKTKLPPAAYDHVVNPNTAVEVKIIEDGKVKATSTTHLHDIQLAVGSKTVVPYERKIEVMDTASFRRAKIHAEFEGAPQDYKVIPELHIETSAPGSSSFRIVFTLLQPFRYDFSLRSFNATLGFLLVPETETTTTAIQEPVNIEVVSNVVNTINPGHLQIPHLNLPTSKIELLADHISDSAEVKVITASNTSGYSTYLKVEPALEIYTNRTSLQGYGIQTIPVDVRFIGSSSSDSVKVNFSASKGSVSPGSMYVRYNQPSTVYVRSEGIDDAQITATTSALQSNVLSLRYAFPAPFLLFSIMGGLIGGLIKHYFVAVKRKFPAKPIIGGILIGFIVAVAYYFLGINLIGLSLTAGVNEMAVLGLSALGAYFGINVSPKLTS